MSWYHDRYWLIIFYNEPMRWRGSIRKDIMEKEISEEEKNIWDHTKSII